MPVPAIGVGWAAGIDRAFGALGGFVAGSRETLQYLRFYAHPYVYSCALPPAVIAAILKGLEIATREPELRDRASRDLGVSTARLVAQAGRWYVYEGIIEEKRFLWKRTRRMHRVLNAAGVICLARDEVEIAADTIGGWAEALDRMLQHTTRYGDSGAVLPETYLLCGTRLLDLSGGIARDQMHALASAELEGHIPDEPVVILCIKRV